MYDRVVLRSISEYLSKFLNPTFKKVKNISFAYQKGRGVRDALIQLKNLYRPGYVVLKVDIYKFFDNINKDILLKLINSYNFDGNIKSLIERSLSPEIEINDCYDEALVKIKNGIPQGNSISSILSNLYLLELDKESKRNNLQMIRYADDILFVCKNIDEAHSLLDWVCNYLKNERKLTIHPLSDNTKGKTVILTDINKNKLIYLGVEFDGNKLLPTKECQNKLISKVIFIIKSKGLESEQKIIDIRKCVKQWCGYYAFTDITHNRLLSMSKCINKYGLHKLGECWEEINLVENIRKSRRKQNNKLLKRVYPLQFYESYDWLIVYN